MTKSPHTDTMSRTILPPWSEFRKTLGVEQAESAETFDWMLDEAWKNDLQLAKKGIDSIEGARQFLKDYRRPLEDAEMDPMRYRIGCAMGNHHSGASSGMLMKTYTYLLNNWDEFVLKTKDREQRKATNYDKRQIHYSDQDDFLAALKETKADPEDREKAVKFANICFNFRQKFGVSYSNEALGQMIPLIKREEGLEGMKKLQEAKECQIEEEVGLLTFLYRCPIRWFSYEGGLSPFSVRNVSTPHIIKMIALYPDYMEHYTAVLKAQAEWGQMRGNKKPTAAFFEVFKAPEVRQEKRHELLRTYPDYDQHIKVITESRDTQLQRDVLGMMFATAEELASQRAARAAQWAKPLSSLDSAE